MIDGVGNLAFLYDQIRAAEPGLVIRKEKMPDLTQQQQNSTASYNRDAPIDPRLAFTALSGKCKCKFAALLLPPQRNATLKDVMAFSNWPPGLLDRGMHFMLGDRTDFGVIASGTIMPFRWEFKTTTGFETAQSDPSFEELLVTTGLFDGWVFPVHGPLQLYGFAMVSGLKCDLSEEKISLLHAASIKAFSVISQSEASRNPASNNLSELEIRTLQLLANGASTEQVGSALGLSDRAVNMIITAAKEKLKANQPFHAIAIAVRKGIIH